MMLKTLDILSKTEIERILREGSLGISNLRLIIWGLMAISVVLMGFIVYGATHEVGKTFKTTLRLVIPVICILTGVAVICNSKGNYEPQYEYTIYVDDKETAGEIYDNYDVIKIEGDVWTIQDK